VYDGNGNLLDDGERTYQWDAKNRLIEAKRGADTWQWSYNAFDQRVSEKKNGVVTKRWVWAGGNQPAEERDAAGNVTRRFYPQGEQAGTTKSYYTKDHLGSIREVMGANGTVVSSSRYDAWGARTTVGAQDAASFGFTGHLEHKELGLVFTLYRAYDPVTGRWLSRDPIGEDGGINLYGYVSNNPVNLSDPLGLWGIGWGDGAGNVSWNIGWGDPTLLFTPESGMDVSMAAAATLDGINPFGDPLADIGAYDECDPAFRTSRMLGGLAALAYTGRLYVPPATLYHHTSVAGAAGIAATGGIRASATGIGGMGTYLSSSPSAAIATLQGAGATGAVVPVAAAGLRVTPTIVPGSFVVRGASVLVP
jgi:RHS repeat-associated protein